MSGTEEPRSTRLGRRRPARLPHNERTNEHSGEDRPLGGCCRGGGQKKRGERAHSGGLRLPAVRQGVAHDGRRRAHLNDRVPVAERQPDAWKWPVPAPLCGEVMFGTCECITGGQTGPGVGYPSSDSAWARLEAKRPHKMGAKKAPACDSRKKIGGGPREVGVGTHDSNVIASWRSLISARRTASAAARASSAAGNAGRGRLFAGHAKLRL